MLREGIKAFKFIKEFKNYENSKDEIVKKRSLLYIKDLLKAEGGIFTKFLQYRGTSPEEMEEIRALSSQKLSGISKDEILSILKDNLGEKSQDLKGISSTAIAASVGQVHFAKLNGKSVAIKIQYPEIKATFIEQLKLFKILPATLKFTPLKKWGLDISMYQKELNLLIEKECNYNQEAEQLTLWKGYLENQSHCFVPEVFKDYSNEFVIVQSRVDGENVDEIKNSISASQKRDLAEKLTQAFFHLLFNHHIIQGDTNHGNFLFNTERSEVYFIDLGQTIHFSERFVNAIIYLLSKRFAGEDYSSFDFLISIGFDREKLHHIYEKLDLVVGIIFQPLFSDFAYNLKDWNYKKDLDLLLGEDKWWFRSAGGVEFFLFMKSFLGIKNLICKFESPVYFRKILNNTLSSTDLTKIEIPRSKELPPKNHAHASKSIQVLVIENKKEKVKLTLPFMAIFELDEYFSEDIKDKIKEKNINLSEIIQNALSDGGKPKEIFHLSYQSKTITITLIQ